jgi:glycosyltransferase involved in cell wall biosynthesis
LKSPIKVFFGINESGVSYWRGKVPALALQRNDACDVRLFSVFRSTPQSIEKDIMESEVIFMPSPTGVDAVLEYVKYYQLGKVAIADYDDDLFDCHPLNPGYSTLGLNEAKITMPDGKQEWLWKDQRMGFSLNDNRKRFIAHTDVLRVANIVTTTTPYLKEKILEVIDRPEDEIVVLPNSVDFNTFKPFERKIKDHSKLRIGWAASDSHLVEGKLVAEIITKLKAKRQDFQFVVMGNIEKFRQVAQTWDIEWHPFTELFAYPSKLASLELDIGLCPLEDVSFNRSKSALKWSEYSALKIPSVCSDIEPYQVITDRHNGILAKDSDGFVEGICALMDSEGFRNKITSNAYDKNFREYNIDVNYELWLETFERALIRLDKHNVIYKGEPLEKFSKEEIMNGSIPR